MVGVNVHDILAIFGELVVLVIGLTKGACSQHTLVPRVFRIQDGGVFSSIGWFRIVQQQKNRVEVHGNN